MNKDYPDSFERLIYDLSETIQRSADNPELHKQLQKIQEYFAFQEKSISQLKSGLSETQKRLEKYHSAFKMNPSAMTITTVDEGKYLEVNDSFTRATGYTREEVIGKTVYDINIWKDVSFRNAFVKEIREKGYVVGMKGRFVKKDGTTGYTRISAERAEFDGHDCLLATFEDLTKQEIAQEKFESLFNNSADAIIIHNFSHHIIEANKTAEQLTGYIREELLNMKISDLQNQFSEDDIEKITAKINRTGEITNEIKILTKSGALKPVLIFDKIIDFEGKKAVLGQIHDMTARIEAEQKTKESEELLRTLINSTPDIVCFKDGEGRWLEANKADLELFNLEEVDYRGKTDMDLSEHTLPVYRKAFEECKISDEFTWEKGSITHSDENIPDKDGNIRTYDVIKVPLFHEDGSRKGMVVLGRDITIRKQTEKKLSISEEHSRSILSALPDMIFEFDRNGNFLSAHSSNPEDLQMDKKEFIGKNLKDVFDDYYVEMTMNNIKKTLSSNSIQVYQYKMIIDDGVRYFESRMVPKGDNHTLAIVREITRQVKSNKIIAESKATLEKQNQEYENINKKLQQTVEELKAAKSKADESNRLKSAFLATMSHELRTPLNSIIGFSEMIQENPELEDVAFYGKTIHSSGNHLLGLVEEIFDLSLIESGQARAVKEFFFLKDMMLSVNQIMKSHKQKLRKEHIELIFEKDDSCINKTIYSDQVKLKQVMLNLIKNAIKFTESGYVRFGCMDKPVNNVPGILFYVEDTGIGIPKYKQEKIFDMFYQADNSDTRKYGGSGIGLSVAKKITSLLDGSIELESRVGKGTTFKVWIPAENNEGSIRTSAAMDLPFDMTGKTILIAEDDVSGTELLRNMLKVTNAVLITVENGEEAVKRHTEADMVLMDLQMPDMGGLEATRLIKSQSPHLPVIAITARAMKGDKEEALKAGCDDYLSKPFKKSQLLSIISKNQIIK